MPRRLRILLQLAYTFLVFSHGLTLDQAAGQALAEREPPLSKWRYLREEIAKGRNFAAELRKAAALLAAFQTSGEGELMFAEYDVLNGSRELSTEELSAIKNLSPVEGEARWERCKALGEELEQSLAVIRDDGLRDMVRHVRHCYGGWHNAVRLRLSEDVIGQLKAQFASASDSLNTYIEGMEKLVSSDSEIGEKEIWTTRRQLLPGEWRGHLYCSGEETAITVNLRIEYGSCLMLDCHPPGREFHVCARVREGTGICFEPPRLFTTEMLPLIGGLPEALMFKSATVAAELEAGELLTVKIDGEFGGEMREVKIVLRRVHEASRSPDVGIRN